MAVFYKYQYTNKRKNIHPWNWEKEKVLPQKVEPFSIMSVPYTLIIQLISERPIHMRDSTTSYHRVNDW